MTRSLETLTCQAGIVVGRIIRERSRLRRIIGDMLMVASTYRNGVFHDLQGIVFERGTGVLHGSALARFSGGPVLKADSCSPR